MSITKFYEEHEEIYEKALELELGSEEQKRLLDAAIKLGELHMDQAKILSNEILEKEKNNKPIYKEPQVVSSGLKFASGLVIATIFTVIETKGHLAPKAVTQIATKFI